MHLGTLRIPIPLKGKGFFSLLNCVYVLTYVCIYMNLLLQYFKRYSNILEAQKNISLDLQVSKVSLCNPLVSIK